MIVCVCKAVSDRHIRAAVADGATSMREITRELKVGTCCGKCLPEAKAALMASLTLCGTLRGTLRGAECGVQRIQSATNSLFGGATEEFAAT